MRVIFWGVYDLGKPRVRILRDGLRAAGVEVIEVHRDLWRGTEDKTRVGPLGRLGFALRWLLAYPRLILLYLHAPSHDVVFVPYLGQLDVLVLRPFARLRGRPVIWDMFISLFDTVTQDRRLARPESMAGRLLRRLERRACGAAELVLIDTAAHARHVERLLDLPAGRLRAIPVGAEPEVFPPAPPRRAGEGPLRILFYGQLIPLHGVRTILEAALSEAGRAYRWRIIGSGQEQALVERAMAEADAPHVEWEPWVDYGELEARIAEADICLGIFGASEKAASVVPNKVYQALFAGRPVITRDSPAMRELFPESEPGLRLVPHSDSQALLAAVAELAAEGCPSPSRARLEMLTPPAIGARLREMIEEAACGAAAGEHAHGR